MRDVFAREAIAQIPKILTLMDRNQHSPSYGCCDRNFWQYKIIDFPSGMAQEFVYPLALAYHTDWSDNPFYQQAILRDWVDAGIQFAATSAHKDGSCDDYFPFERAGGAAAFSLLACVESYQLMQLDNYNLLKFFERRANWLAHHNESGRLANHQALIVLCLELLSRLLQTSQWDRAKALRLERVLDWQNEEGWFQEYEGCDPGYHTLTISCLARLHDLKPDPRLEESLTRAVELASYFVHPDGSYGGEYTSRNTYNFFPHGFELVGRWLPEALSINDRILGGLAKGLGSCYADDHIVGHHTWNYLLAWQDFASRSKTGNKPAATSKGSISDLSADTQASEVSPSSKAIAPTDRARMRERIWLENAKILIDHRQGTSLYLALNKGGAFKLFRDRQLIASDTQFSLQVKRGRKLKNAVGHLVGNYKLDVSDDEIVIQGQLGWAKQKQMTPFNLLVLRLVMFTIGRFFPNLIRAILQKVLIVGKSNAPFHFTRRLTWTGDRWQIRDELHADMPWHQVQSAKLGSDQTSIYVVMSRTFHAGQLQPWLDLTADVKNLSAGQPLKLERQP